MLSIFNQMALTATFITHLLGSAHGLPSLAPRATIPLQIMPIGDSITWGWVFGQGTNGYRQELLADLTIWGYRANFLGTQLSGTMANKNNEGYPGYRISEIQAKILPALSTCPNIALIHAGTNDFVQPDGTQGESWYDAPARLESLIKSVLAKCPGAVILVAKIIPRDNAQSQELTNLYNNYMPTVIGSFVHQGYKVVVVDQSVISLNELGDGTHPTPAGYNHMGDIWASSIKEVYDKGYIVS